MIDLQFKDLPNQLTSLCNPSRLAPRFPSENSAKKMVKGFFFRLNQDRRRTHHKHIREDHCSIWRERIGKLCRRIFQMNSISILIFCALKFESALGGGDYVGNVFFDNVRYAYAHVETFIQACLKSNICELQNEEQILLNKILTAMAREKKDPNQIQFPRNENLFYVNNTIYLSLTDRRVGAPIYFNVNHLLPDHGSEWRQIVGVETAIVYLIRELGFHHEGLNRNQLRDLGVKLQTYLTRNTLSMPISEELENIRVQLRNLGTPFEEGFTSELLLSDTEGLDSISQSSPLSWSCPQGFIQLGDPVYSNPLWIPQSGGDGTPTIYTLYAHVEMRCVQPSQASHALNLIFAMEGQFQLIQGRSSSMKFLNRSKDLSVRYYLCETTGGGHPYCVHGKRRGDN